MIRGPRPPQRLLPLLTIGGKDSETQTKPFYEFERRKEVDGVAVVEKCHYAMRGGVPALGATAMTRS